MQLRLTEVEVDFKSKCSLRIARSRVRVGGLVKIPETTDAAAVFGAGRPALHY